MKIKERETGRETETETETCGKKRGRGTIEIHTTTIQYNTIQQMKINREKERETERQTERGLWKKTSRGTIEIQAINDIGIVFIWE